jgi:hypothetical protein
MRANTSRLGLCHCRAEPGDLHSHLPVSAADRSRVNVHVPLNRASGQPDITGVTFGAGARAWPGARGFLPGVAEEWAGARTTCCAVGSWWRHL